MESGWRVEGLDRKTRFGDSGGGYSVISKPVLTEKRGVDHFDWTFFTVMSQASKRGAKQS